MNEENKNMDGDHAWEALAPRDLAVSFRNLGVSTMFPPRPILNNVSGFVKKGGITAGKVIRSFRLLYLFI